ncbi:adenine DNA glycosylase isoform 2-T2 [Menidia menidia]
MFVSRLRSGMSRGKRAGKEAAGAATEGRKKPKTSPKQAAKQAPKKAPKQVAKQESIPVVSSFHSFQDPAEVARLRSQLLGWYDRERRELPWRTLAETEADLNIRTYAVWVSEIMLQQTQVSTATDYYNRWMKEVNQMWAGLGYYSRGRRLYEGARKVVLELGGQMPQSSGQLLDQLPGVGRYTAGAVASIALGQVTGAVDGNVVRVLCRLRAVGADSSSPAVQGALWALADLLVDPQRPGDFNQALMELGAQICTPKGAECSRCPLRTSCHALHRAGGKKQPEPPDVEECVGGACALCPREPWDDRLGVHNFPRRPVKKPPRPERTLTCVVTRDQGGGQEHLVVQRPHKGLLAGLWEFPSLPEPEGSSPALNRRILGNEVSRVLGSRPAHSPQFVGEVVHVFSHIHQTYVVHSLRWGPDVAMATADGAPGVAMATAAGVRWLGREALLDAAMSTGQKKILKLFESVESGEEKDSEAGKRLRPPAQKKKKKKKSPEASGGRQLPLRSFFKPVKEECS